MDLLRIMRFWLRVSCSKKFMFTSIFFKSFSFTRRSFK